MMTVLVALKRFPLAIGQTGRALSSVTTTSSATNATIDDDSAVIVTQGERLCEIDLLNGVLVHSGPTTPACSRRWCCRRLKHSSHG